MKVEPLISVVIPAFNAERTLAETVDSVLKQSYRHVEIIIVNDGSTDNTLGVGEELAKQHPAVSFYSKVNQGPAAARNHGFAHAKGTYIVFLDADDFLAVSFLADCLAKFLEDDGLSVVYTQTQFFERVTGVFKLPTLSMQRLLIENCLTATAMIRSDMFREIGMYDESLRFAEDWEMWIRLFSKYPNAFKIEKPLFFYRRRNSLDSITDRNVTDKVEEESLLYIYQKHYALYKQYGYTINRLLVGQVDALKYREKYYNVWYRKLFYKLRQAIKGK